MKSRHSEKFNHDPDAATYDEEVLGPSKDPVREGYRDLLDWVAQRAGNLRPLRILELGSGTGNLSGRLLDARQLVCVDNSSNMLAIAREKHPPDAPITSFQADLLEFFEGCQQSFDLIVSTYAIHHLMPDERTALFGSCRGRLVEGGRVLFGDLMFESAAHRAELLSGYRNEGLDSLADSIEDEFFWLLDEDVPALEQAGFSVTVTRFSTLSWGIEGRATPEAAGPS